MLSALIPLVLFAAGAGAPAVTPKQPAESPDITERRAPADVAQALVDADQILAVHQAAGIVVFDLDRASEHYQLTVAIDDDGGVVDSTIDWVGATGDAIGIAPVVVANLPTVDRIDWDAKHGTLVLRSGSEHVELELTGRS